MHVLPTAMMDISDGLSSELMHICKQSGVGAQIYENKIPIDYQTYKVAEAFNFNATTAALNGGEDYELVFTINQKDFEVVKGIPGIAIVGHIAEEAMGITMVSHSDQVIELQAQGWDALKNKK